MRSLRELAEGIPGVRGAYRFAAYQYKSVKFKGWTAEEIFSDIVSGNKWRGAESLSGQGSGLSATRIVRAELPVIFRDFDVHSVLDIPCGDFHWMKHVDLEGIDYTGAELLAELVEANRQHEREKLRFCKLNVIADPLPAVDLIFCRDCLVHLRSREVLAALENICRSGSKYLLATTYPSQRHNDEIATGQWRRLNLQAAPFLLPAPLRLINEQCADGDGTQTDKSLGLWRVTDIAQSLARR